MRIKNVSKRRAVQHGGVEDGRAWNVPEGAGEKRGEAVAFLVL